MCQVTNEVLNKAPEPPAQFIINLFSSIFSNSDRKIDRGLFEFYAETLSARVDEGWEGSGISYNEEDILLKEVMRANSYHFSAQKAVKVQSELNKLARSSKSFDEFKQGADKVGAKYNVNHLRTEYNSAVSFAQNGAAYRRMIDNKKFLPYAVFRTVGDNRVRPEHAALNGTVVRIGSSAHQSLTPPLSHGCRCRLEATDSPEQEPISDREAGRRMTDSNVAKSFQKPRTPRGNIFDL